ncbi:hypothetical protein Bca101_059147 [Brassica carinata]
MNIDCLYGIGDVIGIYSVLVLGYNDNLSAVTEETVVVQLSDETGSSREAKRKKTVPSDGSPSPQPEENVPAGSEQEADVGANEPDVVPPPASIGRVDINSATPPVRSDSEKKKKKKKKKKVGAHNDTQDAPEASDAAKDGAPRMSKTSVAEDNVDPPLAEDFPQELGARGSIPEDAVPEEPAPVPTDEGPNVVVSSDSSSSQQGDETAEDDNGDTVEESSEKEEGSSRQDVDEEPLRETGDAAANPVADEVARGAGETRVDEDAGEARVD